MTAQDPDRWDATHGSAIENLRREASALAHFERWQASLLAHVDHSRPVVQRDVRLA